MNNGTANARRFSVFMHPGNHVEEMNFLLWKKFICILYPFVQPKNDFVIQR